MGSLFWLVADEYRTTEPEFDYAIDFLRGLDAFDPKKLSTPREGPRRVITRDGVLIETRSAEDFRKIAEKAPDGIIGCEVGRWPWEVFLRVSGRLAQKRGWAWLSGSFERSLGWQAEKFLQWSGPNREEAQSWGLPSWSNPYVYPGGEDDPELERLRASVPADYFMERYGGLPVPPSGRVYHEFEYTTHVSEDAEYTPGVPVEVWIDPGYAGAYVVLAVQMFGELVNVVDEVYVQRLQNAEVIALCQRRPWWKDASPSGVIDIAGRGHAAERSPIEAWRDEAHIRLESEFVHIHDGIQRVHSFLHYDPLRKRPGLLASPRCVGFIGEMGAGKHPIEGMGAYTYPTDAMGTVLSERPNERNNHACSALAYGLVKRYGLVRREWGSSANWTRGGEDAPNWMRREKVSFEGQADEFIKWQQVRERLGTP